ncbi:hypothetical protein [Streptomyces sp. NBC_01483]|uniref:hypothetical protein n=1 Tax=Streptomyces sp. NBC_01483 TaxID=2903883 RepID=UPI002E37567E|nr:hypothetical protein [Streptomyces sp. NBC_01483]
MNQIPTSPSSPVASTGSSASAAEQPAPPVDFVLAGRAVSTGAHIAGLILAAQLDTVGTPRKLPRDLFPGVDPAVVQEIWDRAMVVGVRAGQLMAAPRFNRDRLARLQGELAEAGFHAMGGMAGRSRVVAERAPEWHPGDGEIAREH